MTFAMLEPPVFSPNLKCSLRTVNEGIDYVRLTNGQQNHPLVQAARAALYRAEDSGARSDTASSVKLANALFVLWIAE